MIVREVKEEVLCHRYMRVRRARLEVRRQAMRTLQISLTNFNQDVLCDEEYYRMFHFLHKIIGQLADVFGWKSGKTKRNRYFVDPVTAICVMMRKPWFRALWKDVETLYVLRHSALSGALYEFMDRLVEKYDDVLNTFRRNLMRSRTAMYDKPIHDFDPFLDNCVVFVDCTHVQISHPKRHGRLQQAKYSGQKRIHCLIYQTVTTLNGLLFYMYVPKVVGVLTWPCTERVVSVVC